MNRDRILSKELKKMTYNIFIVEDEFLIRQQLKEYLEAHDFICHVVTKFDTLIDQFKEVDPHLVLMDVNLPVFDGYYWSRKIRQESTAPIIIVSARNSDIDQIYGIENGADDFVTKPFSFELLMVKINSHLRRVYGEYSHVDNRKDFLKIEGTTLDLNIIELSHNTVNEGLSITELKLAQSLFEAYPNLVKRQKLFSVIWDDEEFVEENTLTVNIKRLRNKMKLIESDLEIRTIRGAGYQLVKKNETIY